MPHSIFSRLVHGKPHGSTEHLFSPLRKPTRLHTEQLEDRLLMNADNPFAASADLSASADASAMVANAVPTAKPFKAVETPFPKFQSAEEFDAWLLDAAVEQWGNLFGTTYRRYFLMSHQSSFGALASAAGDDFSGTNVQVEGVDSMATIVTFDLASDEAGPTSTATVISDGELMVYATEDSVYVFSQSGNFPLPPGVVIIDDWGGPAKTFIWKFDIGRGANAIELSSTGEVNGSFLNQFSVDEHNGYLRVVAGKNWGWTPGGNSYSLFVLEEIDHRLVIVGSVNGFAPRERLHSVRFMGDRAFAVTFQKVDPLFAFDLSDPANPLLVGELVIPGFSDYLQPLDATHLIGIGRGANESVGLFEELQFSIFDVGDLTSPELVHRYSFGGGRSTATIATGNRWVQGDGDHQAVGYYPSQEILAVPIQNAGATWRDPLAGIDNSPVFEPGKGGLQVFRIDVDSGFASLGIIKHDSQITRSLRIGDCLFAVSTNTVTMHDMTAALPRIGEVDIRPGTGDAPVELVMYQPSSQPAGATAAHWLAYQSLVASAPGAFSIGNSIAVRSTVTETAFGDFYRERNGLFAEQDRASLTAFLAREQVAATPNDGGISSDRAFHGLRTTDRSTPGERMSRTESRERISAVATEIDVPQWNMLETDLSLSRSTD